MVELKRVRHMEAAMQGCLGFKDNMCLWEGILSFLCVTRCRLCLLAASLRLRFERKKKNAKDKKWRKNRGKQLSSSCSRLSAPDPVQEADNNPEVHIQCY